jgi:HAD superfamily hydrolase (TIGR01509 family)
MHWIDNYDLFLFDFDGLLVNTEHIHYQSYVDMCLKRNFKLDWSFQKFCEIAHVSKDGLKLAIYAKFPKLFEREPKWEILREEKNDIYFELIRTAKVELMPGVKKFLEILEKKGKRRCVVTNSLKEQTDLIKAKNRTLKIIEHWITREDYIKPKPNPEGYLRAIELYSEKGDRIMGFEDTIKGLRALNDTPAKSILVCHAHRPQLDALLLKGALHFESFEELLRRDVLE